MATIYTRLKNQNRFKNHIIISGSFYKNNEEDQRSDEIELSINLKINHTLTQTDINNIDIKSQWNVKFKYRKQKIVDGHLIKLIQ